MRRNIVLLASLATVLLLAFTSLAPAQASPAKGTVISPPSTQGIPGIPRTPLYLFIPEGTTLPLAQPQGETPASIACIYGLTKTVKGCPLVGTTLLPTGGVGAVALIEYGHYSQEQADLNTFSKQWGLPTANFQEVCIDQGGCPSNAGTGWDLEEALDLQWAHAMAPNATIFAVETGTDMFLANQQAGILVAGAGGGEISNSWVVQIGSEPPDEQQYDKYLKKATVAFFAAAGDWGWGALYPSASPFVVSAGGTTIHRDQSGNATAETCWSDSGGGISKQEPRPAYQDIIQNIVGNFRGTPDMSAVADPASGVAIYSSTYCGGWCVVGGTSVASPVLAGIMNDAGKIAPSTTVALTQFYKEYGNAPEYKKWWRDITVGSNGSPAGKGWDQCTGFGSPVTYGGK